MPPILLDAMLLTLAALYALWILYLAVMSLKRARKAGLLSRTAYALGLPVLALGLLLDLILNVTVMSIVLWDLPRETTITARLKRHHTDSGGWRLAVVKWLEPLLDPYDPDGDHI